MKKIMFNDKYGLTDAVLQVRKPMTRRICKEYATRMPILSRDVESFRFYPDENIVEFLMKDGTTKVSVPPYKNNEVLAVAQCYEDAILDVGEEKWNKIHKWYNINYLCHEKGLHNKMFVRADLMPHQIQITDFNIERLQDISDEDCLKEGIIRMDDMINSRMEDVVRYTFENSFVGGVYKTYATPREAFAALIERPGIGHKGDWSKNPWVFVYSFELLK